MTVVGEVMAIPDEFPVSNGHALVIPRQHVSSIFELSPSEYSQLWECVRQVRQLLVTEWQPAGFSIGVNDGSAAGQTVNHAHIHIIPRYHGDRQDPRGGVRWVLPEKAKYWDE
jgi:diadenosine tetraphosphate (Ap4A) HIT family hydrolase